MYDLIMFIIHYFLQQWVRIMSPRLTNKLSWGIKLYRLAFQYIFFYLHTCFSAAIVQKVSFFVYIISCKVIKNIIIPALWLLSDSQHCLLILLPHSIRVRSCFRLCTPVISSTHKAKYLPLDINWQHLLFHFVPLLLRNVQTMPFHFRIVSVLI